MRSSCATSRDDAGPLPRGDRAQRPVGAFRIAAAPAVGALVWHGHHDAAALAGCALSLTDWLDGYLAQKLDQETILGKFLDPLGDKALVCCVGVPLALRGELPLALVGLVVARDVGLVFGTRQALRKARSSKTHDPRFFLFGGMDPRDIGLDAAPSLISKLNTGLQFVLGGVVLARGGDVVSGYLPAVLAADATVDALCGGVVCSDAARRGRARRRQQARRRVASEPRAAAAARRRDRVRSKPRRYRR